MTNIHLDFRQGYPETAASGYIEFVPSRRLEITTPNKFVLLPQPVGVELVAGQATVNLRATDGSWAWIVYERVPGGQKRAFTLISSGTTLEYTDMVWVDPSSFELTPTSEAAWVATLNAVNQAKTDTIAARDATLAVQKNTIVGGTVTGDNLVLTRYDNTTFTAGNVRGPKGDKGDQGDITLSYRTANVTGAQGIGPALARTFRWTLAGNTSVNSIGSANSTQTGTITFIIYQAGAGTNTFTHPPEVTKWLGGAPAPVLPTGVGNGMMFHYFWDGIGWYGIFAGYIYA